MVTLIAERWEENQPTFAKSSWHLGVPAFELVAIPTKLRNWIAIKSGSFNLHIQQLCLVFQVL